MRVLWLVNILPAQGFEAMGLAPRSGGSWLTAQVNALGGRGLELVILCFDGKTPERREKETADATYVLLPDEPAAYGALLAAELARFSPDIVHIHGTEYPFGLAMLQAAGADRCLVTIQGLSGRYASHYFNGLPPRYRRASPIKALMHKIYAAGDIAVERRQMARRGKAEERLLAQARHVAGRTRWDKACLWLVNPVARYHHCGEILRPAFYEPPAWTPEGCRRHSIFISQGFYPIKGAHHAIKAMPALLARYPDAHISIGGQLPYSLNIPGTRPIVDYFFEYQGYLRRLTRRLGLESYITWTGPLGEREMREAYLRAHMFLCPSAIENSPNSLGEAMILGTPVVSANVGGVADMLRDGEEGFLYPQAESYLIPYLAARVFEDDAAALERGRRAAAHARQTHAPETVTKELLAIYDEIADGAP